MVRRLAIALLTVAVFQPLLSAQMRGPGVSGQVPAVVASAAPGRGIHISFGQAPPRHPFIPHPIFLGAPYFYSDYAPEPAVVQAPLPQVVVVQAPPAASEVPEPNKPEALLIEWRDDRYVRFGGTEASSRHSNVQPDYAEVAPRTANARPSRSAKATSHELAPTVLVFRDGHHEEIREYAIADGVVYARGDYWLNGYWNKKILFSALDLPATIAANREAGVEFVLPSGPNVVMTRP